MKRIVVIHAEKGDRVVVRWTSSGTQQGELMGIPPTGKQFSTTGIEICRFEGGKIVEHWLESDMLGLLQQLGALPSPAQTRLVSFVPSL